MRWTFSKSTDDEYYVVPSISNDSPQHTDSGFCYDTTHECHENADSIYDIQIAIDEGEITTDDADRIYYGRTV